ncbi:MAG: Uma2 family endonuclease, partial [Bryobacteraceae bacterium]
MGSTAATRVSIDEYLSNPAYEHCEYVDGEIVELKLGKKKHSLIQSECVYQLKQYQKQSGLGTVLTELHCRLTINGQTRFRLPDVCVVLRDFDGILDGAP